MKRSSLPKRKVNSRAWHRLSNPLVAGMLSLEDYQNLVGQFIVAEPNETLEANLRTLLVRASGRAIVNTQARTFDSMGQIRIVSRATPEQRLWNLYRILLTQSGDTLSKFVAAKKQTEKKFLIGQYSDALAELEEIRLNFGESIWYLRQKCVILSYLGRSDEIATIFSSAKQRLQRPVFKYLATVLQLLTDTDENALLHWKNSVSTITLEFQEGGLEDVLGLISLILSPQPLVSTVAVMPALWMLQLLPLVDLYEAVVSILCRLAVDEEERAGFALPDFNAYVSSLSQHIDDPILARIQRVPYAAGFEPDAHPICREIIDCYETGRYEQAQSVFWDNLHRIPNPVHYCFVAAKAAAHRRSPPPAQKNVLSQFAQDLYQILTLSTGAMLAYETMLSRIVKLNGMTDRHHMQTLAYMSLPNRFDQKTATSVAQGALIQNPEASRLLYEYALSKRNGPICEIRFENKSNIPRYRTLRYEICKSWEIGANPSDVFRSLGELVHCGGLVKDYLEIFGQYCLATDQLEAFLPEAARHVVVNSHVHLCLPLEHFIHAIEQQRLSSLEAVVLAHIYLRYVSDRKDYVLNEALEEYLAGEAVSRPSELLARKRSLSALEQYFFFEVCVPDILDYLSCFSATSELRAERVQLLDRLLELGCLTAERRMAEVEELVSQTVIDAMTTKLNGPKIYVDTATLVKKIAEEVNGLVSLYRDAEENEDLRPDRMTFITDESDETSRLTAYVSGSKNTILLKIRRLFRAAFLFDERGGLDKNLSTEIRHGFFSNLMRSRLEDRSLLMEFGSDNVALPNRYWRNANSFLTESALRTIDEVLTAFTKSFNAAIAQAEEHMKIGGAEGPGFKYELTHLRLKHLQASMERLTSTSDVIAYFVDEFWRDTETQLNLVREYLNVTFRQDIDCIFEELETELARRSQNAPLLELTTAIELSRAEIKEDISTAAEWFRRTEFLDFGDRTIEAALRVAVTSFQQIRPILHHIEYDFPQGSGQTIVPGYAVKALILAVINLLDNSVRHSGRGRDTSVHIQLYAPENGHLIFSISNDLSDDRANSLTNAYVEVINQRARDASSARLLRAEGGSGLGKAFQHLTSSLPGSDLTFQVIEEKAVVEVLLCL